jgi:hypothetical protein
MEFDKMEFDKEKVLTPFTAHKAKKGDVGWIGIEPKDIYHNARFRRGLVELTYVNYNLMRVGEDWSFYSKEGNGYYFYPAPYEYLQKKWVEENNLKVGDKIKIVRSWERGEKGFIYYVEYYPIGEVVEVTGITSYKIKVIDTKGDKWVVPYYAIEKVEHEYRPFKDAEEFKDYREKWWIDKETGDNVRFVQYCEDGLLNTFRGLATWKDLFEEYLDEEGNPAGIKL